MIANELRERLKLQYSADCKCGQCQCVPVELIARAILKMERVDRENDNLRDIMRGVAGQLSAVVSPKGVT